MRLSTLLQNIRHPPPDSMVGHMTRADGSAMRTVPFMILIHLIWLFLWPLLGGESFRHVILPTLLTVPVFLYLHLCTFFYSGPHNGRFRYIAGVYLLAYLLTPFNLSGMGYLIFGFFSLSFTLPTRFVWRVILFAMVLFTIEMLLLHHRTTTIISVVVPLLIFGIVAVYTGYTTSQQAILRRSKEEIMRLATLAERERIGRDLHDLLGHTLSVVALKSELAR